MIHRSVLNDLTNKQRQWNWKLVIAKRFKTVKDLQKDWRTITQELLLKSFGSHAPWRHNIWDFCIVLYLIKNSNRLVVFLPRLDSNFLFNALFFFHLFLLLLTHLPPTCFHAHFFYSSSHIWSRKSPHEYSVDWFWWLRTDCLRNHHLIRKDEWALIEQWQKRGWFINI